jgi:hypothetical protein
MALGYSGSDHDFNPPALVIRGQITISTHQLRQIGVDSPKADAGPQAEPVEGVVRLCQPLVRPAAIVAALE